MPSELSDLVRRLQLEQHPEGGWYRETYRSPVKTGTPRGERNLATLIYYLLPQGIESRLHRVAWDEIWIFQGGGTLELRSHAGGKVAQQLLGLGPESHAQIVIPAGTWFNAVVVDGDYVLASCMVAPGFEFEDLEMT